MPKILSIEQLTHLSREGYVVVDRLYEPAHDFATLMAEYEALLNTIVERLMAAGELSESFSELPFEQRVIRVVRAIGRSLATEFDISLPTGPIAADTPVNATPAVFAILTHDRVLDVAEDVLGPELYASPVQHVRLKLPRALAEEMPFSGISGTVPWHQDAGVVSEEAEETPMLTVWVPLTDATVANGCMRVIPRSHHEPLLRHCRETGIAIPDALLPGEPVDLPMPAGAGLLMHRRTIHSSLPNETDGIRWSFDLRFQPPGLPTGREFYPGFLARSAAHPEQVLRDPVAWRDSWMDARDRLAGTEPDFFRWRAGDPLCA
jgi:phytanoyl-CoA hydroxylase